MVLEFGGWFVLMSFWGLLALFRGISLLGRLGVVWCVVGFMVDGVDGFMG